MSRVVEGFYVRFFWDWLAFISGAFRWKVFAVFADDVGDTSSLSPHAALLTPCPIAINAALDTVVNIRRGLMNGRQISSMEPLLFPFFSSPVDGSIKLIRPSVIIRTSSTLSRALLNHPTDISSGTSITTVCRCCIKSLSISDEKYATEAWSWQAGVIDYKRRSAVYQERFTDRGKGKQENQHVPKRKNRTHSELLHDNNSRNVQLCRRKRVSGEKPV